MTYLDLLNQLRTLTDEQLNQDVTVYLSEVDEFFGLAQDYPTGVSESATCDALDEYHFYLRL